MHCKDVMTPGGQVCMMCLQVRKELGPVDPYFSKLADGMITWIEAWAQLNPNSEP